MRGKTIAIIVVGFTVVVAIGWWVMRASTASESPESIDPERFARAARRASSPFDDREPKAKPSALSPANDAGGPLRASGPAETAVAHDGGETPLSLDEIRKALAKNAAAAERNVDKYCEQSRKMARLKAFAPPASRSKDAALYMASRIDWEGGVVGSLHLPAVLTDRMANGGWVTLPASSYNGLEFSWMTQVLEYDTWAMSTTGPMRDNENINFLEAQIPNFISLQQWSKLRLLKGAHESDLTRAVLEVEHLADLCGSTGLLIGEMIRVAIYGIEQKFYAERGLPLPPGLPTIAEAQSYRRAAFAGMYFMWPGVPKAVREKALECGAAKCSAITEGLGMNAGLRAMLPEARETLDWLLQQKPCDQTLAEKIARSPPASPGTVAQQLGDMPSIDDLLNPDGGSP